jgi:hypothetical protein
MQFIPSIASSTLATPIFLDRVQAGFPSPAQGYVQKGIDLNALMVTSPPATYFVHAQGDSMVDTGRVDAYVCLGSAFCSISNSRNFSAKVSCQLVLREITQSNSSA